MKKSFLIAAALCAATFANAAEYVFDSQESCELQTKKGKIEFKNGCHVMKGVCHFWTVKTFAFDPAKKYSISAEIMTDCKKRVNGCTFALVYFDARGKMIPTREYITSPNGFTELAKPMAPTDTTIVIKTPAGFKKHVSWPYVLAFEAMEDKSDLPNAKVTTRIKKMDITPETITLTVDKPTFASYPAGTKVRLHYDLAFYHPINLDKFYENPTANWRTITASMDIPKGVKGFKPAIIYYDWAKNSKKYFYVRNFKLIEE